MTEKQSYSKEYFRRDQGSGITPPNLLKDCTFADHIVRARGKRDKYTSVSLSQESVRLFDDTLWQLRYDDCVAARHVIIEHHLLINSLHEAIKDNDKAERARAIQALRYAKLRKEGLIDWRFDIANVERKLLDVWAAERVRTFFSRR